MNPTLKNIIAVVAGIVIGSIVNMALVTMSGSVIPPPDGVDMNTPEGVKAGMPLLEAKHFLFPFLAHALGTFSGAFAAAKIAAARKVLMALIIGFFFLLGGIAAIFMIPGAPVWFCIADIVIAYIPMAWLAGKMGSR